MNDHLLHKEDLVIVRDDPDRPGMAVLYDCDGDINFMVPMNWSDDAIHTALKFANEAYAKGVMYGRHCKAREIKKALECECA